MSDKRNILTELWNQQSEWSQRTFGADSVRGPVGPLKHLAEESFEAMNCPVDLIDELRIILAKIGNPLEGATPDLEEFCDCGLLILDAVRRAGYTLEQWIDGMYVKQGKNVVRVWGKACNDDLVRHVEEQS